MSGYGWLLGLAVGGLMPDLLWKMWDWRKRRIMVEMKVVAPRVISHSWVCSVSGCHTRGYTSSQPLYRCGRLAGSNSRIGQPGDCPDE